MVFTLVLLLGIFLYALGTSQAKCSWCLFVWSDDQKCNRWYIGMTKVSFFQPKIKKNKKKGIDHEPRSEDQKNLVNTQHAQTQKNNLHLKSVSVFFFFFLHSWNITIIVSMISFFIFFSSKTKNFTGFIFLSFFVPRLG